MGIEPDQPEDISDVKRLLKTPEPVVITRPIKVSPNDYCPCGSDKKYKKCCMGKEADSLQASKVQKQEDKDDLATMEFFIEHFREIAMNETRHVTINSHDTLPADQYIFYELYCVKSGCDCRNVILNVTGRTGGHLATINHSLDPDGFSDIGIPQTFLDPINKQSRYSEALLELFHEIVLDEVYHQRLEQHLSLMKEKFKVKSEPVIQS